MRQAIRVILKMLMAPFPFGWIIVVMDRTFRRMLWVWSHLRFAALVRDQGKGCVCHWNSEIKYPEKIALGDHVIIGVNVTLGAAAGIRLDNHVRLSKDVILETAGLDFSSSSLPYPHIKAAIHLEEGVWVGSRAIILGGVTIGKRAVVAAGSIVTKNVPAGAVVAGVPARVVKIRELDVA